MTITKKLDGDTLTVSVDGWLDTMTSPQFHDEVQELSGAKNVVLDLGGVAYISSAGLRETVALFRRVSAQGGSFSVRRVAPGVLDVFTLTGFDRKFEIRTD
ncbi:STAS domain-containing protein [Ruminococcus sp.]|uniref:STAS domain-containing protein n=1 Tax=Ruminococcus sp. TaxID=41978 RepID=UPI00389002BA